MTFSAGWTEAMGSVFFLFDWQASDIIHGSIFQDYFCEISCAASSGDNPMLLSRQWFLTVPWHPGTLMQSAEKYYIVQIPCNTVQSHGEHPGKAIPKPLRQ